MQSSAIPLTFVQNRSLGGNQGGTMLSKKVGLTKCITPAVNKNAAMIRALVVAVCCRDMHTF
jgi:hypothetical protein